MTLRDCSTDGACRPTADLRSLEGQEALVSSKGDPHPSGAVSARVEEYYALI